MKSFKNLLIIMLTLIASLFIGCKKELEKIKVLLPSGAPLIAVGDLLDNEAFDFTIANGADLLSASLITNDFDMIIAPLNLGAKLHIAGKSNYKMAAVITTNNTYVISNEKLDTINDLKDKNILGYGQNSTPDILLKAGLEKNNVIVAGIQYQTSVADVMSLFMTGSEDAKYSLLAEPQLTKVKQKFPNVNVLNIAEEYGENAIFPQACLFVNKNSEKDYEDYLELIEENVKYLNNKPTEYANRIESKNELFSSLTKEVLAIALPNCNINYITAKDNKDIVNDYITLLNIYAPKLLGGQTVNDEFYY